MPLYEYFCRTCKQKIELLVMSGETPVCACGGRDLERLFSRFASPGVKGGSSAHSCDCTTPCTHCTCH